MYLFFNGFGFNRRSDVDQIGGTVMSHVIEIMALIIVPGVIMAPWLCLRGPFPTTALFF